MASFVALAAFAQTSKAAPSRSAKWPTLSEQLGKEYHGLKVRSGTALEALIRKNQDFTILHEQEKNDKIGVPAWLRVWYRKAHPENEYSVDDPSGGYPRVLNEILEWMVTHQDLKKGPGISGNSAVDPDEVDATVGSDLRISGAQTVSRSESDIRINYLDAQKIISASNNIGGNGLQAIYYSTNGGASWSQTTLPATGTDQEHSDPTCDWTSDGTAWSSTLGIVGNILRVRNYFSTNNGATWTFDGTPSGTQTDVDKQMVWVDHSPSSPYRNQMYAIWHNGNPAFMNRRTANPGGTWGATPIQVSGAESSGTCIGADVKTNGAGDVFGAWPTTTNRKLLIVKSTNGGASFGTPVQIATTFDGYDIGIPAMNNRRALIYITIGAYKTATKDNVYATWTDLSGVAGCTASGNEPCPSSTTCNVSSTCKTRVWFSRSTNGGATWSAPVKINNQAGLNDQFNQWMAVDESTGGIAITYYDTVNDSGRKKTDLWYQSSNDDGASWSAAQKVTGGTTDETISGADSGNQYGDYNSLSGNLSTFFPSWTDRRNNAREEIWTSKIVDSFTVTPHMSTSGSAIQAGSCGSPAAATIDPNETVTVNFCVQNDGNGATGNVTGTLQATGGVTNPSAPQSYGVLNAGSGAVCRSFTFTASGTCGGTLTANVQLQDGATNLGTIPYTFTLGAPNVAFAENFDGVAAPALPANWSASNASGTGLWVTSATTPDSSPNDAFVDDPATVSDKRLDSASFVVPSTTARLTFRHNYNLQASGGFFFDGGVLEVSSPNINGGTFTDVTNAAVGGSFVSGGYVGAISNAFSNPLAGRQAWSGNSNGYVTTVVNLGPNVVGQTIKIRFRMGSDTVTSGTGWRIDSLVLQDGYLCACAPVALTFGSRGTHGADTFDVDLAPSGPAGIEPRSGGANGDHQIVANFTTNVSVSTATVTSGVGSVANFSVAGSQVTVNVTGVSDAQTVTVTLGGVTDASANTGNVSIPVAFLAGDTNGDGSVNSADISQTKSKSGQTVDASNFRCDVNFDDALNSADISFVKSKSGNALP